MAEPTLGQRIAEAAAVLRMAEVDHGVSIDAAMEAWAELLPLCDRADAAERLARAERVCQWTVNADGASGACGESGWGDLGLLCFEYCPGCGGLIEVADGQEVTDG